MGRGMGRTGAGKLMGQDKDGKITYWLLSRAKQSRLGENSFIANLYIYITTDLGTEKQRKNQNT